METNIEINKSNNIAITRTLSPTQRFNPPVDYTKNYNHFAGARFVIEIGIKLKSSVLTVATAATYYHKFYATASLEDYDPYLIGCTCIYLASKVEDDDIKIRDIINVGISTVRRGDPPLSLDPYFSIRDALIQSELLLMRMLGFKMKIDLPHRYLLHYIKSLEDWIGHDVFKSIPIVQAAWLIVQDIYHSSIVLHNSPQLLAVAILNLVMQIYGVVIPGCDEISDHAWFCVFHADCTTKAVWDLTSKLVVIYEQEKTLIMKE